MGVPEAPRPLRRRVLDHAAVHARRAATRTSPPRSSSTRSSRCRWCCSPAGQVRSASARSRSSPSGPRPRARRTCTGSSSRSSASSLAGAVGRDRVGDHRAPRAPHPRPLARGHHARVRGGDVVVPAEPRPELPRHQVRLPARRPHRSRRRAIPLGHRSANRHRTDGRRAARTRPTSTSWPSSRARLVLLAVRGLQRSRTVRDLIATRDNERNAQAFRLSPTRAKLLAFALVRLLRVVRGRRARAPPAGARPGDLRPGREHPRAHHGGRRRSRLGARRDPRRGLPEEHRVVQRRRAAPVPRSSFQFAGSGIGLIVVLWLLPGGLGSRALPGPRHVAALGRPAPQHRRAVAHRRHRRRPRAAHRQGQAPRWRRSSTKTATVAERHGPKFLKCFATRPMPDVDYFSYPDLALSGGTPNLLSLRSVDVAYGQVQVLFGVSLELRRRRDDRAARHERRRQVDGAARDLGSRRARSSGSISHDGVDISGHRAAPRSPRKGVIQVPGGKGVFPSLTVAENLQGRRCGCTGATRCGVEGQRPRRCSSSSPALRSRMNDPAAQLSGGQQQMLALAMAFLAKPEGADDRRAVARPRATRRRAAAGRGAASSRRRA